MRIFFLYVLALVSCKLLICKRISRNNYFVKNVDRLQILGIKNLQIMTLKGVTEYLTIIRLRLGECFLIISETDPRVLVNNIYRYIYIH